MTSEVSAAGSEIESSIRARRERIDAVLEQNLRSPDTTPPVLHEAMRYTVLGGGKRIRPVLAVAAAETVGADPEPILKPLAALELIHTYSLVHDDLPALDDDELRRGRATAHVVYGEAIAILAGDALLTEAFRWLSEPLEGIAPGRQLRGLQLVADAIDSEGMIGGQVLDLLGAEQTFPGGSEEALAHLESIHANKTGRLLTASVLLGGVLAGASDRDLEELRRYGTAIGLAFQIVDDILDEEQSSETLGKTAGKDAEQGKLTYPSLIGVEAARAKTATLLSQAVAAARRVNHELELLPGIAHYICERSF